MSETTARSPAQPAVVLGLTFLAIGLTYALPFRLIPESERLALSEHFSPEVANVYACVAWAGWGHFLFAFRGQATALTRIRDSFKSGRIVGYMLAIACTIIALLGLRSLAGVALFGAVVWLYFIDHFIKAEQAFEGKGQGGVPILVRWLSSYQPLLTFGWLSVVLLNVGHIHSYPWLMWTISSVLGAIVLVFGGWRNLISGDSRSPLLSLFFVGEALVWGATRRAGETFLTGVYVFHVAAGSYFHYFGAYFVANARAKGKDKLLTPLAILGVNAAVIGLGCLVAFEKSLSWLAPILGTPWFTLWVALHLVSSDFFPAIKTWRQGTRPAPSR